MWFALPAVTLGARFDPWGMVVGTSTSSPSSCVSTVAVDPASASAHSQALVAAVALVLSTVILSGALVESDRAHRRRSTLDPLTGLFNRNALEQRLAELDGAPCDAAEGPVARAAALRPRSLQAGQRPARPRRRRRGPAGRRLHDAVGAARRRLDLPDRRRGDPRRPARARARRTRSRSPSACARRCASAARPGSG